MVNEYIGKPNGPGCPVIPWENKPFKNKRVKAKFKTNSTFFHYLNYLTNLTVNLFEYENLPDSVDPRFMELTLFNKGMAVFFIDEVAGPVCLNTTINGRWNLYNIPIYRRAYATNGYQRKLDSANSVIIFNNYTHTPTYPSAVQFAERLTNLERSIDVNIHAQRTPYIIGCDQSQLLTFKNLYKDIEDFMPIIYGRDSLKDDKLIVYPTTAPLIAPMLQQLKNTTLTDYLTFIGVENSGRQKAERENQVESSAGNGLIQASRNILLDAREQAVNQINQMFNLDIKVKFRNNFESIHMHTQEELAQIGGGEDVGLYGGTAASISTGLPTESK